MPRKRATKGTRSRSAREARAKRQARYKPSVVSGPVDPSVQAHTLSPRELYLHEKARRASRQHHQDPNHPLQQARRMYEAMLAAAAESGKGGRPKKIVVAKKVAQDEIDFVDE